MKIAKFWTNRFSIITIFLLGLLQIKKISKIMWAFFTGIALFIICLYIFFKFIPDTSIIFTKTFDIGLWDFMTRSSDSTLFTTFFLSLLGTITAAATGAWMAHIIAIKRKLSEELEKEIKNTNSAIVIAGSICKMMCIYTQEIIIPRYENYHNQRNDCILRIDNQTLSNHSYDIDLNILTFSRLPIGILNQAIIGKVEAEPEIIRELFMLESNEDGLIHVLNMRSQFIDFNFSQSPDFHKTQHGQLFLFGLLPDQKLDELIFPKTIKDMRNLSHKMIKSLYNIHNRLAKHSEKTWKEYIKIVGDTEINIPISDFSKEIESGLISEHSHIHHRSN